MRNSPAHHTRHRALRHLLGCALAAVTVAWAVPSHAMEAIKPEDSAYRDLKDAIKYAETKCPKPSKAKKEYDQWLEALSQADDFLRHAKCNAGGKDKRCKEVAGLRKKVGAGLNAYFTACFANPKTQWYHLADTLILAQNHKVFFDAMPKLDAWFTRIGKEKAAYWVDELRKAGGLKKYVQRKGDTVFPYGDKKGKKLKFHFGLKDKKLFLKVYSKKPRNKLKGKPKNDYLRVKVEPNAYYLVNQLKAKAKWRGTVGTVKTPLKAWRSEMAGKKAHVGSWAYLDVYLFHAWITGKAWQTIHGKRTWADRWTSAQFNYTRVLVKLR